MVVTQAAFLLATRGLFRRGAVSCRPVTLGPSGLGLQPGAQVAGIYLQATAWTNEFRFDFCEAHRAGGLVPQGRPRVQPSSGRPTQSSSRSMDRGQISFLREPILESTRDALHTRHGEEFRRVPALRSRSERRCGV